MSWDLIFQHLFIVLAASLLSIAVGLPLGIWAYVSKVRLRGQFSVLMRNSTGDLYKDPASASYSASTGNINGEKTESTQKRTVIDGSLSLMYNNTFKGHNLNICLSSNMRQTQSTASETRYRGFPGGDPSQS